jgi:hypothetical protein
VTGDGVRWLTAASGLAGAVLVGVGGILGPSDPPGFDALPEQVVRWTLDDRRRLLVSSAVVAVGLALLIVFYAGLRAMLGRAEGPPALLATVGWGSFLVVIVMALMSVAFAQMQAFAALDGSPDTVRTLHEARYVTANLSAAPTIVSAVAFAVVMLRTRLPARWLGWGSALVALTHVPALFALSNAGALSPTGELALVGPFVFLVWVLCVSVTLLVGGRALPAH